MSTQTGCNRSQNITCRAGKAAPKVYLPRQHFHFPPNSVKKGELHCEDFGQNITCRAGQAAPKVYLPHQHFHLPPNSVKKGELHCKDSGQNITCRAGQAAPKVYLPHQHFHLPCHSVKKRWVTFQGLWPKHYLPSGASEGLADCLPN